MSSVIVRVRVVSTSGSHLHPDDHTVDKQKWFTVSVPRFLHIVRGCCSPFRILQILDVLLISLYKVTSVCVCVCVCVCVVVYICVCMTCFTLPRDTVVTTGAICGAICDAILELRH